MKRKGVSPLIAAVLLLAVTISAASIVSGWAPNVIKSVTQQTQNQTETAINCNRAAVKINTAKFYTAGETSVVVTNTGQADLDDLRVSAWRNDLPQNSTTTSLGQGNFTTVNVTTTSEPDFVKAFSKDCTSVSDREDSVK